MILNVTVIHSPYFYVALSLLAILIIIRLIRWILDILP